LKIIHCTALLFIQKFATLSCHPHVSLYIEEDEVALVAYNWNLGIVEKKI
jgi:hypothetical protein